MGTSTLPAVLDSLHAINIERATSWQQTLLEAVAAERAVVPILAKCREDMEAALVAVSPQADCQLWVERYKTGNVPPGEYQFEDLSTSSTSTPSSGSVNAKTRTLSRVKSPETGENSNLFPRKRELEKRIACVEAEVAKGQKEMAALQLMVATYRQNPKFGDAAKFQGELEAAILRVQVNDHHYDDVDYHDDHDEYKLYMDVGDQLIMMVVMTMVILIVEIKNQAI